MWRLFRQIAPPPPALYPGTQDDYHRLLFAVFVNCANRPRDGQPPPNCQCAVHRLLTDPRALERFAFVSWLRPRLIAQEFDGMTPNEWLESVGR